MQGHDVVVVGAGNAGLCAALSAREAGARVLVLEKAPRPERGGNAYSTMVWMRERGVRWLPAMGRQSFRGDDGRYHFFGNLILEAVGGGQGLSDQLFDIVERNGVEIAYDTKAVGLQISDQGA